MRAVDRRSDSAKIHNLPTARSREGGEGGKGCFLNLITGSKCLIPNIDTGNRPQEKVKKKQEEIHRCQVQEVSGVPSARYTPPAN